MSVLAKMRACTISYGPSLHRKINAVGIKKKSDPISVLHVAVSVIARMCTCTRVIFYVRRIGLYLYKYRIYGTITIYILKGLPPVYHLI